jgi:hypothetical protein
MITRKILAKKLQRLSLTRRNNEIETGSVESGIMEVSNTGSRTWVTG